MPAVNSTVSTSTVTQVSTIHQVTTVSNSPALIFGLPPAIIAVILFAVAGIVYAYFKLQVKGVPVELLWVYKNGTALMIRSRENLQGIFLDVIKGGKKIETLKKSGIALPVKYLPPKFKAHIEVPDSEKEGPALLRDLQNRGFKVREEKAEQVGVFGKRIVRTYLVEKAAQLEDVFAYLDVSLGGLKSARLYGTIEGTGKTFDWKSMITGAKEEETGDSNSVLVQEMDSAFKAGLKLLAESIGTNIILILAVLGSGVMIGLVIAALMGATGHPI